MSSYYYHLHIKKRDHLTLDSIQETVSMFLSRTYAYKDVASWLDYTDIDEIQSDLSQNFDLLLNQYTCSNHAIIFDENNAEWICLYDDFLCKEINSEKNLMQLAALLDTTLIQTWAWEKGQFVFTIANSEQSGKAMIGTFEVDENIYEGTSEEIIKNYSSDKIHYEDWNQIDVDPQLLETILPSTDLADEFYQVLNSKNSLLEKIHKVFQLFSFDINLAKASYDTIFNKQFEKQYEIIGIPY